MQSQLACSGCRNILLYPRGAGSVRCALCNTVTPVQATGLEMDHLICGVCRTLLMYSRGATSVRCMCCHTVNLTPASLTPAPNQVATLRCGSCHTTLMYPFGAPSVKCAVCQYITNIGAGDARVPVQSQYGSQVPSASTPPASIPTQTVVVENPMSRDESGKLVSNVVVGVTAERK
uniref:LSD1 n=1 Tax=Fagopyrum tataricum TaxID=62330 RepID=A0A0E3TFU5_FAGTA|nr:LSD1 [Fagopyrum tataricum]